KVMKIDKIPKDSIGAGLMMWSHFCKVLNKICEHSEEDESFLLQFCEFFIDGDFDMAFNMFYSLSQTQKDLIPVMVVEFLKSYKNRKDLEKVVDVLEDSDNLNP